MSDETYKWWKMNGGFILRQKLNEVEAARKDDLKQLMDANKQLKDNIKAIHDKHDSIKAECNKKYKRDASKSTFTFICLMLSVYALFGTAFAYLSMIDNKLFFDYIFALF